MPRKPHSAIVDRLRGNLSSLVHESTEIRGETNGAGVFFVFMRAENLSGLSGFLDA